MAEANPDPRFVFHQTPISGVVEVELLPVSDHRGAFARLFDAEQFAATGQFPDGVAQTNVAHTREAGTARGLHWQEPAPGRIGESKLVLCAAGRIFDVAVDLRRGSPTRLQHHALELAAGSWRALLIPPGVAHGMQALEADSVIVYHHSAPFDPSRERGAHVEDPALAIPWPSPIRNLSPRDLAHPPIAPDAEVIE